MHWNVSCSMRSHSIEYTHFKHIIFTTQCECLLIPLYPSMHVLKGIWVRISFYIYTQMILHKYTKQMTSFWSPDYSQYIETALRVLKTMLFPFGKKTFAFVVCFFATNKQLKSLKNGSFSSTLALWFAYLRCFQKIIAFRL